MAEVKNNVLELTSIVTKLNVVLNENIKNLNNGAAAVDNYNKKFSTIPSEYQKALVDIKTKTDSVANSNKNLEKTSRQLEQQSIKESNARNALNKQREKGIANMAKENSAYLQLAKAEAQAARTLQDLIAKGKSANQTQQQYNATLKVAQNNFDQLRAKLIMADSATQRFNRNVGNYKSAFSGMAGGIRQLMSAFGVMGGIFLFAQAIRGAFTTVKDFDKANADLAATMGKNRAEIVALTNDQKRLGASTRYTATEVAGLQKEFAKLGFSEKEILNSTEATLALASAVDTDLANAAMVAGSTLRGFGLDASEMGRVVDVMASSFTKSALDVENFRESMKYVAPIAASTGVSLEFATAMLGKLADAGVKGSQAGTSLRRILTEMAKTGLPAAQAFDKVAKSGINVTEAMDEVGRTAQTALLILSKSKTQVNELAEALNNAGGAAQKMADEQLNSLSGQLDLLTSAWDGLILSFSESQGFLGSFFKELIAETTRALEGLGYLFDSIDKRMLDFRSKLQKEQTNTMFDAIVDKTKTLNNELLRLNITIGKQEALLEASPENPNLQKSLALLTAKRDILEKNLELEKKNVELNAKFAISDLQDQIDKKDELLKRLRFELEMTKEQEETYGKTAQTHKHIYAITQKIAKLENQKTLNLADQAAYEKSLSVLVGKKVDYIATETAAKEKKLKVEKQLEEVETNSAAAFKRQIGFLEHQMSITNKANATYGFLEFQVRLLKTAYEALYGAAEKVNEVIDPKFGTADYYENLISVLKKQQSEVATTSNEWQHYNRMIEAVEIDLKNLTGTTEEATKANKEFSDSFRRGFVDDFISNSGFDKLFYLIENFDQLKESGVDTALAISEAFQQAFNTIAQASQANFEGEYSRLEAQRDFSISFAGDSATAKEEIERQYTERKKAIQRREAKAEKDLAIFNAIIDTAQAVVAALPNYGLAIAVGIIGAAQIALISSQPVPQFYKGTDNAPEGWALTQERGAEVITDKKGNVKTLGNNKGAQMTYLNKGDKVYKSHDDYINKQLSKNGIQEMGSYLNLQPKVEVNNSFDMEGMKQEFSKLAKVISNKEGVNISIDENGFNKRKGNTSYINSRLTLKSQQV